MFEVRIIDKSKYPYDFNAEEYFSIFTGDEMDFSSYQKAVEFCKIFNSFEEKRSAYIWKG